MQDLISKNHIPNLGRLVTAGPVAGGEVVSYANFHMFFLSHNSICSLYLLLSIKVKNLTHCVGVKTCLIYSIIS